MKTEAAYVPPFPFTEPEVHTLLRQPSARSAQRKGGGISKGGNLGSPLWLRAKHACIDCRLRKNKPDTKKAYYKRSEATTTIILYHSSLFILHFFRQPALFLLLCRILQILVGKQHCSGKTVFQ